jgi:K(+)-stimulated pyrophosphate-energized sodium pump
VLTAFSLLVTFNARVGNVVNPVLNDRFAAGLLVGAMVPYFFSALTMGAVNKAAQGVVVEVRRQWLEIPGLAEGTAKADYAKCVSMITWCQ